MTPWTAAGQGFLSITNNWSLLKFMSINLVMSFNDLILCHPLLLLPSGFPSIRVFLNESVLQIRWSKCWRFIFRISPSNEYSGLISFRTDWIDLPAVQYISRVFSNTRVQKDQFIDARLSLCSNTHIHTWLLEKAQLWLDRPLLAKQCLWFSICSLGWSQLFFPGASVF